MIMDKRCFASVLGFGLLSISLVGVAGARGEGELDAIWNDPVFKKQFVGGYGINSDIEPRITPE
jgi:hypothetical protein